MVGEVACNPARMSINGCIGILFLTFLAHVVQQRWDKVGLTLRLSRKHKLFICRNKRVVSY